MNKKISFRWVLFAIGLIAIIGLTGMNVYSLYELHENSVTTSIENQKDQVSELADRVRNRFLIVSRNIWKINTETLQDDIDKNNSFPKPFLKVLDQTAKDSLYSAIYFSYPDSKACDIHGPLLKYDPTKNTMIRDNRYPDLVCDGVGLARTRMKVLVKDYQFPTKTLFDTNRSMTVTIINSKNHSIIGYLCLVINNNYLINDYLHSLLVKTFGSSNSNGITVWVQDWVKNKVLTSNNPKAHFDRKRVHIIQQFPDLLNNWNLMVAFDELPSVAASRAQFARNLTALGAAVLLLLGSLVFIFLTAQKERDLSLRQSGFLANVTHELKTPLSVMQAAGENLADGRVKDPDRLVSYGKHIYNESIRLRSMIEKLLDVAKYDAGQMMAKPTPYHLNKLVKDYIDNHRNYIESNGFTLEVRIDETVPLVKIDTDTFDNILGNLIENAIKYSHNDKYICISVRQERREVIIDVEDHGLGIPHKAQKHIFDKFYRVENTLTANSKGHGLGLSIVQNMMEMNNGFVTLKSQYRKGSKFSLHFPVLTNSEVKKMGLQYNRPSNALTKESDSNYVVHG